MSVGFLNIYVLSLRGELKSYTRHITICRHTFRLTLDEDAFQCGRQARLNILRAVLRLTLELEPMCPILLVLVAMLELVATRACC